MIRSRPEARKRCFGLNLRDESPKTNQLNIHWVHNTPEAELSRLHHDPALPIHRCGREDVYHRRRSGRDRALQIVDGLRDAGEFDIDVITDPMGLARKIKTKQPDIVLIDIADPSRDTLEELASASGPMDRPVAMFVDRSEAGMSDAAIQAGVSAYVVNGLQPTRVKPVLDAAIARFRIFQRMSTELAETKRALEERKVIDRAKGMFIKARGVDEDQAYAILRKAAMDQGKRVADVAAALVTAAGILS